MKILLDSSALLILLEGGEKSRRVQDLIAQATSVHTTVLNAYDMKYRVANKYSPQKSAEVVSAVASSCRILPITLEMALSASEIKRKNKAMGAVDCNTLAAARLYGLTTVTGDLDFPKDSDVTFVQG